jgi:outer membrane protein
MIQRRILHAVLWVSLLALSVPGISRAGEIMALPDAIKVAMENNHEIRAHKNALLAQKETIGVARSALFPKVYMEERALRTNNPPTVFSMKLNQERFTATDFDIRSLNNPSPINDMQTLFAFEQPVLAGSAYVGLTMAKNEYSAQNEEFRRKQEDIVLKVVQAYLRVHVAQEQLAVAEKGLEDAREHRRIAEARYKANVGLYSDTLRAATAVTEAEQRLVRVRKDLVVGQRWLGLLVGRSEPVGIVPANLNVPLKDVEYYVNASLARKDFRAMQMRHENAKNGVKLVESRYLPNIGVGGAYQMNDPNRLFGSEGQSWRVSALLRWDLFDGTHREYERSKAQHKVNETEEHLKGLKQFIAFKIHEAYLTVEEAKKNSELSLSALTTAEEGKRLVRARYETSLSPIVDLLDVQLNLDRARADVVMRQNEYQFTLVNLSYESGTIMKDLGVDE